MLLQLPNSPDVSLQNCCLRTLNCPILSRDAIDGLRLRHAAPDDQAAKPSEIRHSDLSVYRADDGTLKPIRTTDDWALRRKQIIAGAEAAMGPMPSLENQPAFDIRLTEDVRIGKVRRLTMTIAVESSDRLPLDLYLPESMADVVNVNDLLNSDSPTKLAAIVALHPTGAAGKRIVCGEGEKHGRQYGLELAQRGYVVIAPDYPSFGEYDKYDFASDNYVSGTMKGIFNHRRCVDFLAALKFVDADRIGVIGHSLGGHNAIFLGAFDERLKVIVSSCGWCPFHDYYGGDIKGWTSDRYMPRLRDVYELNPDKVPFDFYELIACARPAYVCLCIADAGCKFRYQRRQESGAGGGFDLHAVQSSRRADPFDAGL